jgi:hypothetical protein
MYVGTVPANEGLAKQLFAMVTKHGELLTGVLSMEDEPEDEPSSKKIPLLLIQGITQFTLHIPCNETCSKVSSSYMRPCPRHRFNLLLNIFTSDLIFAPCTYCVFLMLSEKGEIALNNQGM